METNSTVLKEKLVYSKARSRAKKLREFYSHLRTYLIMNTIFFVLNLLLDPSDWWVLYPVIGWGFCLTIHALDTFASFKKSDEEWEERKTKELIDTYKDRNYK